MEKWRSVEGFPGYEVSSLGRVRSFKRAGDGRVLKPSRGRKSERAVVTLYIDAKPYYLLVARLVCIAFRGPPPTDQHQAAHLDDNVHNDKASNLDWLTRAQNLSTRKMPRGGDQYSATLTDKQAIAIRGAYQSAKDAGSTDGETARLSKKYKVGIWVIRALISRKTWKHI